MREHADKRVRLDTLLVACICKSVSMPLRYCRGSVVELSSSFFPSPDSNGGDANVFPATGH
jgi:hypothetical protein